MKTQAIACAILALAFYTPALHAETSTTTKAKTDKSTGTVAAARKTTATADSVDISPDDFAVAPAAKGKGAKPAAAKKAPAKPKAKKPAPRKPVKKPANR